MTYQLPQSEQKLIRVQEKGQVTLPTQVRKNLGIKKGDLVAIIETPDGILITPQEVIATNVLDRIGTVLKDEGMDLDALIESSRKERGKLVKRDYGSEPGQNTQ